MSTRPIFGPAFFDEERLKTLTQVYVFCVDKHLKIGRSQNWERRLKGVQTGSPYPVEVVGLTGLVEPSLEQDIHSSLHAYRVRGEWFKDDPGVWEILKNYGIYRLTENDFCPRCDSVDWGYPDPCDFCDYRDDADGLEDGAFEEGVA